MKSQFRFPIFAKCIVLITLFSVILGAVAIMAFGTVLRQINEERFNDMATNLSQTVADTLDVELYVRVRDEVLKIYEKSESKPTSEEKEDPAWAKYIEQFSVIEESEDFLTLRDDLRSIQNANPVDCTYLSYVDANRGVSIYIVDAAMEEACAPGTIDPIYEMNLKVLTDPKVGFPAYSTSTEAYGNLVSAGVPIFDGKGEVVGYAMTDIPLDDVRAEEKSTLLQMIALVVVMIVIITIVAIVIVSFILVRPIRMLKRAADKYSVRNAEHVRHSFSRLHIKTRDELEELLHSIQNMENDINHQIEELVSVNSRLTASQNFAEEMSELANTDGLAGVGNITAYNKKVREIEDAIKDGEDIKFAVVMIDLNNLKSTNDTYGHEQGDEAIKGLSQIICSVFDRSYVFRIGGDEFAVILQDQELGRADELFGRLTEKMDELSNHPQDTPEFRSSASSGMAAYVPGTGDSFAEVFRRADEDMYLRKRAMKKKKN